MKFKEGGPEIPEKLLLALDEGRVVFFCGAGVSRARANLPDFFGLADQVLATLGVSNDSPAFRILQEARNSEQRTGIPGLISADRVFGLLERDFLERDVERVVAQTLAPRQGADLSAHKLLLDLATTKEGVTKLVTTNFDRLFEDCGRKLKAWQPPRLPDPARPGDLNGIVYLHGRANEMYDGPEGDGFVLSSAEFGRAYLAEGWATRFFKGVIDRYAVVFVGYNADDPPVQYLLEALKKSVGTLEEVYAFQSGEINHATARWLHKGVTVIPYDSQENHAALWQTLEEWSKRSKDPEGWQVKTIAMAQRGPEALSSIQREQVAHLVSTKDGARKFSESDPPAPATWLCVFDPLIRYAKPGKEHNGLEVDPFAMFGLASDLAPTSMPPDDHYTRREIPSTAWDAFSLNRRDRMELRDENITRLRGDASLGTGRLPDRINNIGLWIGKVAHQNAAIWWGARQNGLHRSIEKHIRRNLDRLGVECAPHVMQAWHYIFEDWRGSYDADSLDWYSFAEELNVVGWTKVTIRKYERLSRPRLVTGRSYVDAILPPHSNEETSLSKLIRLDLYYNEDTPTIAVPDEWLAELVPALKRNLDIAIQLETEFGRYSWIDIPPIIPSDERDISTYARKEGLSGAVLAYAALFERLLAYNVNAARQEAATWSADDNNLFARLRIWASRFEALVPDRQFTRLFKQVSQNAFWNVRHQRDLLLSLSVRWATLPTAATRKIEERILEGPERWLNEPDQDYAQRKALAILERLCWLHLNGCSLNTNYEHEIKRLKKEVPEWSERYGETADRSLESRGGLVRTDTEHSSLLSEPLSNVLKKAQELGGRRALGLVEFDPFFGLCQTYPVRALSALRLEAKDGEYPDWAWQRLLSSEQRKNDNDRIKFLIAELVFRADDKRLEDIIFPVTDWLLETTRDLSSACQPAFERLTSRLLIFLQENPDKGGSGIVRGNRDPDWAMEALNSPAGKISQTLFHDPCCKNFSLNEGFPGNWKKLAEFALSLPGENSQFALVFFSQRLDWFHYFDPEWTKSNLLTLLDTGDENTIDAWWTGYLWNVRRMPKWDLFNVIKPQLLARAANQTLGKKDHRHRLTDLVLAGWAYRDIHLGTELITDNELRQVLLEAGDGFRAQALWILDHRGRQDGNDGEHWKALQERFLRKVWPIQRTARTPQNSVRLTELAFSNKDRFMAISEAVLPLLSPIEGDHIVLPSLHLSGDSIIEKHPKRVLEILYSILPENATSWPFRIESILERITAANPSLRSDVRWVELMRRWNSR